MKYFYILIALAFLASCGAKDVVNTDTPTQEDEVIETTLDEIESELEDLLNVEEDESETAEAEAPSEGDDARVAEETTVESKVVKLDAAYTNPAGPVDMTIEYSLDSEGKIEAIEVAATTYDLTGFNESAQKVIGMTVEDAANEVITGGSLTDPAFSAAMKNAQ